MESAEIMFEKIFKRYNKNPKGWKFSIGTGYEDKFFDILVSNDTDVWQIKLDTLYRPNPLGVGVRVGRSRKAFDSSHSFGFRPITEEFIPGILETGFSPEVIEEIMRKRPQPLDRIQTPGIVQGPINFSDSLDFISERHKKLDNKLRTELDRLLGRSGVMSAYA
ncbi:MAG: hypothetical protein V3R93_07995 [Candidatus Hydrothermarchaeaceae archaeon]